MVNVRDEGQPRKFSEIQSDASRVTTRVSRLGARLLFGGTLRPVVVVFSHGRFFVSIPIRAWMDLLL